MLKIFATLDNFNTVSLENLMITEQSAGELIFTNLFPF